MNDAVSPFTPPSSQEQATGVPMYYYTNNVQQPQQPQGHRKKSKKPSVAVHLPFPYGVRCAIYSIVLVIAFLSVIFAAIAVGNETYETITVTLNAFSSYLNMTYVDEAYIWLYAFGGRMKTDGYSYRATCDKVNSVVEAGKLISDSRHRTYICIPASGTVRASGGVAVVVLVFSVLLLVLCSIVLGLLGCHRKRARRIAVAAAEEVELQQMRQTLAEANATGQVVYVVSDRPLTIPSVAPVSAAKQAEEAAWQEKMDAQEAKVRQVFAVVCLVCCIVGLVFSVVGLATAMAPQSGLKNQMEVVRGMPSITGVSSDGGASSLSSWPHICNLVFYAIAVVLLAVPYLSGITDRPAAVGKRQEERQEEEAVMVGGHIVDEEIQTSGASYTK